LIKVLVYVQHLLGIGHLQRTALITSTLAYNGFDVTVVSGGIPEPLVHFGKVTLVQLPGVKTNSAFTGLFMENGTPLSEEIKQLRTERLINVLNENSPDFVLIETYPFGRRQMRFELLPLLEAIKDKSETRPIVACSIRDVIQPKAREKRVQEVCDLVNQYFDYVFVHGDENFIRLDLSFPAVKHFSQKLVYTGYVTKPLPQPHTLDRSENNILVSAGGGAVGEKLYRAAVNASRLPGGKHLNWHIVVGGNLSQAEFDRLADFQSENLTIERNRTDFLQLLGRCTVSVSQAGYNTMMDILVTGTPAVVVPFEGQSEQEQLIRALAFADEKWLTVLREISLNGMTLLTAIEYCGYGYQNQFRSISMDGADRVANFIKVVTHKKQ
jgi:predicted glycosyltransferase